MSSLGHVPGAFSRLLVNDNAIYNALPVRFIRTAGSVLFAGCAIALSSCSEGSHLGHQTIAFDENNKIDVQPIRVCNNHGSSCAQVNLFEDITQKILAQAKLKVNFLPTNQLNQSRFLTINSSSRQNSSDYEFYELSRSGGRGDYGRHPRSTRTSGPINVWYVDEIESTNSLKQYGLAWVDANGIVISDDVSSQGRSDTLAHEIGHNLGLRHASHGAGDSENLLTSGSKRLVPKDASDVYPDGAGVSHLNHAQISEILGSPLVSRTDATAGNTVASDGPDHLHIHDGHNYTDHIHTNHSHADHAHADHIHTDHSHVDHAHADHAHADSSIQYPALRAAQMSTNSREIPEPSSILGVILTAAILTCLSKRL